MCEKVLQLGKQCAVSITGWSEDADDVTTYEMAFAAINEALRLGLLAVNDANLLRMRQ